MHDPQKATYVVDALLSCTVTHARSIIEAEDGAEPVVMPQLPGEDDVDFQRRRLDFIHSTDTAEAATATA
jgi:hypothetical protein